MLSEEIRKNKQFLIDTARQLLVSRPDATQVVLILANSDSGYKLYHYFATAPSMLAPEEEDACIRRMQADGNTWVANMLCMVNVETPPDCIPLEVPCWTIRKKIRGLDPRNDDAFVFGWGDYKTPDGVGGKTLYVIDTPYKGK